MQVNRKIKLSRVVGGALVAAALLPWAGVASASAAGGGNADCPEGTVLIAKYDYNEATNTFTLDEGDDVVTVTATTDTSGTFVSEVLVAAVVVKASTTSKVTEYDPATLTGTFSIDGKYAISHVTFCGPGSETGTPTPTQTTVSETPTTGTVTPTTGTVTPTTGTVTPTTGTVTPTTGTVTPTTATVTSTTVTATATETLTGSVGVSGTKIGSTSSAPVSVLPTVISGGELPKTGSGLPFAAALAASLGLLLAGGGLIAGAQKLAENGRRH